MTGRTATVWFGNRIVGRLREDSGRNILFSYDPGWLDGTGFPISVRLPFSRNDEEVIAHDWFAGLLPEGEAREQACRLNGIREMDNMGLLLVCGADCAGALSILPSDISDEEMSEPPRELTVDELFRLVNSSGKDMPVFPDGGVRFSLSGAQRKLAVIHDDGAYSLSTRTNPSSHILKFETEPGVCFAESITHAIARETGLPMVETSFLQASDGNEQSTWLRIPRYDRNRDKEGALVRLHQEDMLQALGLPSYFKYNREFGPTVKTVAGLLQAHVAQPADALSTLLDWQIMNYLLGNWDGHAKNLSLLYPSGQSAPVLAPCYDMVSIEYLNVVYRSDDPYTRNMGLEIGGHDIPEQITRSDWEQMAGDLGMPTKTVLVRLEEKATVLPDVTDRVLTEFMAQHCAKDNYGQMRDVVSARCRHVLNSVFRRGLPKPDDQNIVTEGPPDHGVTQV